MKYLLIDTESKRVLDIAGNLDEKTVRTLNNAYATNRVPKRWVTNTEAKLYGVGIKSVQ